MEMVHPVCHGCGPGRTRVVATFSFVSLLFVVYDNRYRPNIKNYAPEMVSNFTDFDKLACTDNLRDELGRVSLSRSLARSHSPHPTAILLPSVLVLLLYSAKLRSADASSWERHVDDLFGNVYAGSRGPRGWPHHLPVR